MYSTSDIKSLEQMEMKWLAGKQILKHIEAMKKYLPIQTTKYPIVFEV